jgi:Tol biopolymer transport system component
MNADGSHRRVLSLPFWAFEPDWSPDGKRIAFRGEYQGVTVIYVVNVDGTGVRRITKPEGSSQDHRPRWSPDGKRLLFIREGVRDARGNYEDRIYAVSRLGGTPKLLRAGAVTSASWSPDGAKIAYASGTIHIFDLESQRDRVLRSVRATCSFKGGYCPDLDWQRLP